MSISSIRKTKYSDHIIPVLIGLFFLLAFSPALYATNYYVDAQNGQDNNNGLSEVTAWKTIAKVNSSTFQPTDQILFKRGEIWRETLLVPSSGTSGRPIVFSAYGSGNKPTIVGSDHF